MAASDIGFGTTTEVYYLSEKDSISEEYEYTGFGGSKITRHVFCKDLSGAFAENSSYKYVTLPNNLKKIANYLFYKNTSIENVVLPDRAVEFGESCFENASSLNSIAVPNGIINIPDKTFKGSGLKNVKLPSSVEKIGKRAFEESPVENIDLSHCRIIEEYAFYKNRLSGDLDLSNIEEMGIGAFSTVEEYVGSLGNSLETVILSEKLRDIPASAFSGCAISKMIIPYGVMRIGGGAFYNCRNLETVEIPESVIEISSDSFLSTPWASNLKGEDGVIYTGAIALCYDQKTAPSGTQFIFKEGTKVIANSENGFFPTYLQNWKLESVILPESLIRIGNSVFSKCKDIQSISLPNNLQEIGTGIFSGCTSLNQITIPKYITIIPNRAFADCENLESITLSDIVEYIGEESFVQNVNLFECQLPSSLHTIDKDAFSGCKSLPSLTLPSNLKYIGERAYSGCNGIESINVKSENLKIKGDTNFPDPVFGSVNNSIYKVLIANNVQRLPASFFSNCKSLTKVIFEDLELSSLKTIEKNCFRGCGNLSIEQLPSSLDSIGAEAFSISNFLMGEFDTRNIKYMGDRAFSGCTGLTSLTLSNPYIYLGSGAFSHCENLKSVYILSKVLEEGCDSGWDYMEPPFSYSGIEYVEIGPSLESIPSRLFTGQSNLKHIKFAERVENVNALTIGESAFSDCGLVELILPDGIKSIGNSAFLRNKSLLKIEIPSGCESIGNETFSMCSSINSVKIGEGLKVIGDYAFGGFSKLKSIILPQTCEEIGSDVFSWCNLDSLTFLGETPPFFTGALGYEITVANIYVPAKSLECYKEVSALQGYNILPIETSDPENPGDVVDEVTMNIISVSVINGVINISGKAANDLVKVIDMNSNTIIETSGSIIHNLKSGIYLVRCGNNTIKIVV
ncbi:MAG: leucine-rich repeat protein [Roseburia sp.]|nr:leucine-rich repeat protein [Roseburia sp.]